MPTLTSQIKAIPIMKKLLLLLAASAFFMNIAHAGDIPVPDSVSLSELPEGSKMLIIQKIKINEPSQHSKGAYFASLGEVTAFSDIAVNLTPGDVRKIDKVEFANGYNWVIEARLLARPYFTCGYDVPKAIRERGSVGDLKGLPMTQSRSFMKTHTRGWTTTLSKTC